VSLDFEPLAIPSDIDWKALSAEHGRKTDD